VQFRHKIWIAITALTVGVLLGLFEMQGDFPDMFLLVPACLVGIMITVRKDRLLALAYYPVVYIVFNYLAIVISFLTSQVLGISYQVFREMNSYVFVSQGAVTLIYTCYLFFRKKTSYEIVRLSVHRYLVILVSLFCVFSLTAISQSIIDEESLSVDIVPVKFFVTICLISCTLLTVLLIWQALIEKRAEEHRRKNEEYEFFMDRQQSYIKNVIYSDTRIRSIRHDMRAHVIFLEEAVEVGDMDSLKQYLSRFRDEMSIDKTKRFTGIGTVDAVVNEVYKKATDAGIKWEWIGTLSKDIKVEIFDLCIIFYNLLNNAVEGAMKLDDDAGRLITTEVGTMGGRIFITIRNTCIPNLTEDDIRTTSKRDSGDHGFGIENVKRTVARYNGRFETRISDGKFIAEITA
jgi:sensor histidine kinase YesM